MSLGKWYDERYVAYEWKDKLGSKASVPIPGELVCKEDTSAARRALLGRLGLTLEQLDFRPGPAP